MSDTASRTGNIPLVLEKNANAVAEQAYSATIGVLTATETVSSLRTLEKKYLASY